jgi:hypothetical protein
MIGFGHHLENDDCRRKNGKKDYGLTEFSYSDYIQIRAPVYISHSAGRYAQKRFRKAQCPIIERLTNSLMMNGRNNGKKLMAVRIVAHSFEIVRSNMQEFRNTGRRTNKIARSTS